MSLSSRIQSRTGITITESLAAIAVAATGLFAVIAVIPFAARQAEKGLDLDVSVAVGNNAFQDFDVRGFGNIRNWRLPNIDGGTNVQPAPAFWPGKAFVIDPLFLNQNAVPDPTGQNSIVYPPQISVFPYTLYNGEEISNQRIGSTGQCAFGIDRLNLATRNFRELNNGVDDDGNGVIDDLDRPFSFAQSETIFRSVDELLYDASKDKLLPPNQQFSRDNLGNDLKRSYAGKISWMAMVVPESAPSDPSLANPHSYRLYVIVFRGRQLKFRTNNPRGEAIFRGTFRLPGPVSPYGGVVDLDPVNDAELPSNMRGLQNRVVSNRLMQDDYLQSGDWILLTDYFSHQNGFNNLVDSNGKNWRWYQIQRIDPSVPSEQVGTVQATLVGPDWTGRDVSDEPGWNVHAIALSNVVAVYEKTIRIEYDSIWND